MPKTSPVFSRPRDSPVGLNFSTTLTEESLSLTTYTSPAEGPVELSTAIDSGKLNCAAPVPARPALQALVHTSYSSLPSVTPHPHAAMNVPVALKRSTRLLAESTTYTSSFSG